MLYRSLPVTSRTLRPVSSGDPLTVWRIYDHKPGHANQTRGLVAALAELTSLTCHDIAAPPQRTCWTSLLRGRFLSEQSLPRPDLILGAGHTTHLAVLAARRATGGFSVVLMRPSLPLCWFDLCIVPLHDAVRAASNVIATRGVLNVVRPSTSQSQDRGLVLIGGPAAANGWDSAATLARVDTIVRSDPAIHWTLTTSRRTPPDFVPQAQWIEATNLEIVPHTATDADWLPRRLAECSQTWVTADSVSMVYESLTSGSAVGLLPVPAKRTGRVGRGMQQLWEAGWVTHFDDWDRATRLASPPEPLCESHRCAALLLEKLKLRRAA